MTRGKSPGCSNRERPAKVREPRGGKGGEDTAGWSHTVWLTLIRFRSVSSCLPIVCVLGLASFAMSPSLYSLVGSMPTPGVIKARPCASTDESRAERSRPLSSRHTRVLLSPARGERWSLAAAEHRRPQRVASGSRGQTECSPYNPTPRRERRAACGPPLWARGRATASAR